MAKIFLRLGSLHAHSVGALEFQIYGAGQKSLVEVGVDPTSRGPVHNCSLKESETGITIPRFLPLTGDGIPDAFTGCYLYEDSFSAETEHLE